MFYRLFYTVLLVLAGAFLTNCAGLGLNTNTGLPIAPTASASSSDGNAKLEQMLKEVEQKKQASPNKTNTVDNKVTSQADQSKTDQPKKILTLRDQMNALDEKQLLVQEDVRQIKSTLEDIQQRLQRMEISGAGSGVQKQKVVAGLSPLNPDEEPSQQKQPTQQQISQQKNRKPTPLFADGSLPKTSSTLPDNTSASNNSGNGVNPQSKIEKPRPTKLIGDSKSTSSQQPKQTLSPLKPEDRSTINTPSNESKQEVKAYPEDYRKALQAIAKNDLPQAMALLDKVIASEKSPKIIADAQCWAGETLYKMRQYREAIPRFKETIKS